jgi:hypothetical protein
VRGFCTRGLPVRASFAGVRPALTNSFPAHSGQSRTPEIQLAGLATGRPPLFGARPVFVDCNPQGTDFDYDDLTAKTTDATRAVPAVHLWGRPGDPGRLTRWADEHGLNVIEDACQAQGSEVDGAPVGTRGTIGCSV